MWRYSVHQSLMGILPKADEKRYCIQALFYDCLNIGQYRSLNIVKNICVTSRRSLYLCFNHKEGEQHMAVPFPKPDDPLDFNSALECTKLDAHFTLRNVPESSDNNLLIASWNIANFGVQDRTDESLLILAFIMKRFDLIAVQEVNDNFREFVRCVELMGDHFDFVMSDTGGNSERLAYVYNKNKVTADELFGEVALTERRFPKRDVTVRYRRHSQEMVQTFENVKFKPFDRNPFIGSFSSGNISFVMANVHLYFGAFQNSGSESKRLKYARRVLEIHALAKWARDRVKSGNAWNEHIILLGDMNIPNMEYNESTIKALHKFSWKAVDLYRGSGLARNEKLTRIGGSNLGNDKTYDQIAFAPTDLKNRVKQHGVFDFDNAVFDEKWQELSAQMSNGKAVRAFNKYLRYYLSDHRPIWVELDRQ